MMQGRDVLTKPVIPKRLELAGPVLVIDNYDSFTHNLVQYLGEIGADCLVRRNDAVDMQEVEDSKIIGILISPGPGGPKDTGCCKQVIQAWQERVPVLGVCLGHELIAQMFGAQVVQSGEAVHGKVAEIFHLESQTRWGLLENLPLPFTATRYHSLHVLRDSLPAQLRETAWLGVADHNGVGAESERGIVMGIEHRDLPLMGVQFHPESILTLQGHQLLANFMRLCQSHWEQRR